MKRLFYFITALLVWLAFTPTLQAQDFASGKGSSSDPYVIKTITQFDNVRKHLGPKNANVYFALDNDLDFSAVPNWTPIGIYKDDFYLRDEMFFGKFDGRGHVVKNITIKATSNIPFRHSNIGIFSYLFSGSIVKNLNVENGYMEINRESGGFIAGQSGGVIENCYVTGKIKGGTAIELGGIVGYLWTMDYSGPRATVKNCQSIVDIETSASRNAYLGGIIGYSITGWVSQCYSLCRLVAERGQEVGGVAGAVNRGRVEYSHASGYAKGKMNIGGVLGYQAESNYTTTSYAAIRISKSSYTEDLPFDDFKLAFGGVLGSIFMTLEVIKECYFDQDIFPGEGIGFSSSGMYLDGAVGLTSEEMKKAESFKGITWNFNTKWSIWEEHTSPYVINTLTPPVVREAVSTRMSGIVKNDDRPEKIWIYLINNERMERVGETVVDADTDTWHIEFTKPLNVNEYVYAVSVKDNHFSSAAVAKIANTYFSGGEGTVENPFKISTPEHLRNLQFYLGESMANNFFVLENDIDFKKEPIWKSLGNVESNAFCGNLDGRNFAIRNLKIQSPDADTVGLFSAIGSAGKIANLSFIGCQVTGKDAVGVICGMNRGNMVNCSVLGTVKGVSQTGGLCGINDNTIDNCYVTADVTGTGTNIGGFCGTNQEHGNISKSYALGNVVGKNSVGGFCGDNTGLLHTVFAGNTLSGNSVGGICAVNSGTVTAAFFDKESAAIKSVEVTGVTALTTEQMRTKSSFTDWNFYAIGGDWNIWEGNSYPYFAGQAAPPVITSVKATQIQGICNTISAPDSIVLYRNYERAGVATPGLSSWQVALKTPAMGNDVMYAVAYLTGKVVSRPAFAKQLPNDASLKLLSANAGVLTPVFNSSILNYTIKPVENNIDSIEIKALASNVNAKVKGTGKLPLAEGHNKFMITVTSEDASTTAIYTLTVVRKDKDYKPSNDATIKALEAISNSGGSIVSNFTSEKTDYSASVLNATVQISIDAVPNYPHATVEGCGMKSLKEGGNSIVVTCMAEDGVTKKDYTITITRQNDLYVPGNDAKLQNLLLSEGVLSPSFNSTTYAYTANVNGSVEEVNIMATPVQSGAQVIGAGVKVLNIGRNTFNLEVIAEDGITRQSYSVTVEKKLPSEVELFGINVSDQNIDCSQGSSFTYVAECGVANADISVYANAGTTVLIDGQQQNDYTVAIPETGYGRIKIVLISGDQLKTQQYELVLVRSLSSSIISKRWDNVLAVTNNPEHNGGYYFDSFKWYKNGVVLQDELLPYIRIGNTSAQYVVEVVTAEGYTLRTCPLDIEMSHEAEAIVAYPNPVQAGGTLYLKVPEDADGVVNTKVSIFNLGGQIIDEISTSDSNPNITMPRHSGMYILKIVDDNKQVQTLKILVK